MGQKTVLRKASSSVKCGDAFFLSPQLGLTASPAGCEMGRNPVIKRQLGDIFHDLSIEILPRGWYDRPVPARQKAGNEI